MYVAVRGRLKRCVAGIGSESEARPPLSGSKPHACPRVLLVDDNEAMLRHAAAMLKTSCAIVGAETDGRAAIDAAERLQPDVIVLDFSMPGMNGLEVAASLREGGSTAAVIFCTAHQDEDFISMALGAGALGYVVKHRLSTDLESAVLEAHGGHRFVSPLGTQFHAVARAAQGG